MFDLDAFCRDLETIVNIDSNSMDPAGVNRVADFLETGFKNLKWHTSRYRLHEEAGDYLTAANREADRYDVLMIGHMDTVCPAGAALARPFRTDGAMAYGPGVSDMKAGTLAMYYIARELPTDVLDGLNICIIMNPDEEIGSIYSRYMTMEIAKRTDYAFVMEGTALNGVYTTRRCGNMNVGVSFKGIPQHSGYILEKRNASAVVEMARWILAVNALTDPGTFTTANVGLAEGGEGANIVPAHASMTVNFRFAEASRPEAILLQLEDLRRTPSVEGTTAEISVLSRTPPMVPTEDTERYIKRVEKVFDQIGQPFSLIDLRGGSSDGNYIASTGTICLDSLGPRGGGGHTENEYLHLDQVEECIVRMVHLIKEIAEFKRSTA
ncbi:MAG: M20 family metallopeptidase [Synergistaceae bacterium]|nr:M20 family metallopeptidase [Synergistota bacterium]NLM72149.1 M20 family metallopeptidase [Synergistaceae bacterium]